MKLERFLSGYAAGFLILSDKFSSSPDSNESTEVQTRCFSSRFPVLAAWKDGRHVIHTLAMHVA